MTKRKHATSHATFFLLIKIIGIVLLFLIPVNVQGDAAAASPDTSNPSTAITTQTTDLSYWPPLIEKLEAQYAAHPQDPQVSASLANAYNNYGVLLAQQKQWAQSASYLQQAININPDNSSIKKNLSNVYYEQGLALYQDHAHFTTYTASNAKQIANKAIAADPNNVNGYLLLGDIEYMEQNMQAAQDAWQKAAQLLPDNQAVQKRLAQISRETTVETPMNNVFNAFFNIKIDPTVAQNPNFNINLILDYAHNNVGGDFQFYQGYKVPVVVYNKQEYQQAMVDAPGWAEAIYDGKIRLAISPNQTNFKQLMSDVVHEYTHVIVGAVTNNNCPRWFNEGLAKYEEYRHGLPPRIYMLAMAYNSKQLISWDKINDMLLSPDKNQALLAYQQAFSFVYYLVQRYGMYNINKLLKTLGTGTDFDTAVKQVYSTPLINIENDWQQWLNGFITNWADAPTTSYAGGDY